MFEFARRSESFDTMAEVALKGFVNAYMTNYLADWSTKLLYSREWLGKESGSGSGIVDF